VECILSSFQVDLDLEFFGHTFGSKKSSVLELVLVMARIWFCPLLS
jgi:hypothetical protein